VSNVSSYWFGASDLSFCNNWTQITDEGVSGVDTSATISWQSIPIASGSSLTRSMIVKFGPFSNAKLELRLTFPAIPSPFTGYEELIISGTVTISSWNYKILTVIDDDVLTLSVILDWRTVYSSLSSIAFSFIPATFNIYTIGHEFAFYAVNEYGDVSSPQFLNLSVTPIGGENENNGNGEVTQFQVLSSSSVEVVYVNDMGLVIGLSVGMAVLGLGIGIGIVIIWRRKKIRGVANE
jgi:hypothetical protein